MGKNATTRAYRGSYAGGQINNSADAAKYWTALSTTGFGVFSYYTGSTDYRESTTAWGTGTWKTTNYNSTTPAESTNYPNFLYNQELTYDATWVYSPVKYWPNGIDADNTTPSYTATQSEEGKLSFFAYAPFTTVEGDAYVEGTDGTAPDNVAAKKTGNANGIVAMSTNTSPTDVWVKYSMTNAAANSAVDLLWALNGGTTYDETDGVDPAVGAIGTTYNENLTKQKVGEKVKFLFKHALTKVGGATSNGDEALTGDPLQCGFKVVVDVDKNSDKPKVQGESNQTTYFNSDFDNTETLVTIKEVKIRDAYTYTVTEDTGSKITDENGIPTFGWFDIETGTWSTKTGTSGTTSTGATYSITANQNATLTDDTYTLNEAIKELAGGAGKASSTATDDKELADATGKKWSTANPVGVKLTPTPLFTNENVPALLLIPAQDAVLYITVDYIVRTADPNLDKGFSEVEQVITNKVTLNSANIDPNKYYTIIMHLGLTSVKFEAKVTDWTTTADATFAENGTVTEGATENSQEIWLPSNVVTANAWSIQNSPLTFLAKSEDKTLGTVSLNSTNLSWAATASASNYTITIPADATWLSNSSGTLTATANNASTSTRSTLISVTAQNSNGVTLTTQVPVSQAGYLLALTPSSATVTVKDGDDQNVTSGYTVAVTGGDGKGSQTNSEQTITVTGTAGQTYTVTVTHTASGATATTKVTIPTT